MKTKGLIIKRIEIDRLYKLIDSKVHCLEKKEFILGWFGFMCEVSQKGNYDNESKTFLREFLISELNINGSEYYVGLITRFFISVVNQLPSNEEYYLESMRAYYS